MPGKLFVLSMLCAALGACHLPSGSDNSNWVMRSYDVPPDDAVGLLVHLKDLLLVTKGDRSNGGASSGWTQIGRASIAPNGRLAVVAPPEIQAGVEDLIRTMSSHPALKQRMVDSRYWLVTGKPAKGESVIPPGLAPVAATLTELARQTGPQEFALWEELHLLSGPGLQGEVSGRHANITATALPAVASGEVALNVSVVANRLNDHASGANEIKTQVRIAPDQTVVLAQTGFNPVEPTGAASGNDAPVALYYLVRASVPNGEPAKR